MTRSLNYIAIFLIVTIFTSITNTSKAHADESQCIAAYPCLDDGNIDPKFNVSGFCGDKWRSQCSDIRAGILRESYNACQEEKNSLNQQIEKLELEYNKIQKALRKLKRAKLRR